MLNLSESLYEQIAFNIKKQRKLKKLGQDDLAEHLSISRSALSNIEIAKYQPSIQTLFEIALALECDLNKLLPDLSNYIAEEKIAEEFLEDYNSLPESISLHNREILKGFISKS